MGKYASVQAAIFSVFASAEWISEGILAVPQNYVGSSPASSYIRVSVVSSGHSDRMTSRGLLLIDIFTPAGDGPSKATTIADSLDQYLLGKSFILANGHTQVAQASNFRVHGADSVNMSLSHAIYQVSFMHYTS